MLMRRKKILIIGALLLFLSVAGVAIVRRRPSAFKVETIKKGEIVALVSSSGEIKAERDVTLRFPTSGLVAWVGIKEGDTVRRGQAIASLDKRDLLMKQKKEMNDYLTSRWDFEQTQDNYKETKEKKLVTDAIQRILDKAQFSLNNSVLDYEIADLAVKQATIYSPIDGIFVSTDTPYAGVNIVSTTTSFRIVDPESLYFEAKVEETDIAKIKPGDQVNIKIDAYPADTFSGVIKKINFDSTLTSGGGTAYIVKIAFGGGTDKFRLGMNGDADIVLDKVSDALLVPLSSVFEKEGKKYCWRIENGRARKVTVEVGQTNDNYGQILIGLSEGDKIVTSNLSLLKEGMAIKP